MGSELSAPAGAGAAAGVGCAGVPTGSNRRQHKRLNEVIEEFRSMTDAFPDATLVLDEQDVITWFNDAARNLLGLRIPEDLGQQVLHEHRGQLDEGVAVVPVLVGVAQHVGGRRARAGGGARRRGAAGGAVAA